MKSLKTYILLFFVFISFNLFGQQNTFEWSDTTFEIGDKKEILYYHWKYYDNSSIIDTLANFLKKNSELKIEIAVHTDARGSDRYNYELSKRQAKSIFFALRDRGIPKRQIIYNGYGENCPLSDKNDEDSHQRNRRTEIIILKNQFPYYLELLKQDTIISSHYSQEFDYFKFEKDSIENDFEKLANYFKTILEQDSTTLLIFKSDTARGANRYSTLTPSTKAIYYLTKNLKIDQDRIVLDDFSIIDREREQTYLKITSKMEWEAIQKQYPKTDETDRCKGCPF